MTDEVMEKKEKTSPVPGTNIFDPATLLGASPFSPGLSALPYLAHLPSAFSMLGHPAFPVSSLFSHLGDGLSSPLGIPSSLASSLSPTSGFTMNFDPLLSPVLLTCDPISSRSNCEDASKAAKYGLFSTTDASSSSSHATSTVTASTSKHGSGRSRGGPGSRGRPRKLTKHSPIPMSLVQSTSLLSPSMLEKYAREANGTNGIDSDTHSDKSASSSLFDFSADRNHVKDKSTPTKSGTPTSTSSSSPTRKSSNQKALPSIDPAIAAAALLQDKVHIDSLKKKLIADQIRQRMQNKVEGLAESLGSSHTSSRFSSGTRRRGRGRGRPPRIPHEPLIQPDLTREISPSKHGEAKSQERRKRELELELKQQQIALKLMKNDPSAATTSSSRQQKSINSIVEKLNSERVEPLLLNLSKARSDDSKAAGKDAKVTANGIKTSQSSEPSTSKREDKAEPSTSQSELFDMSTPLFAKFGASNESSSNMSSMDDTNESGNASSSGSESDNSTEADDNLELGKEATVEELLANKRKAETQEGSSRPIKRRHVVLDDEKIRLPLENGWKRQTNIHTYGRRGIVGEVWYFAPCGRKMKTIPDVMRYIERNGAADGLGRDHFSFNTKVNVGEFYEARVNSENGFVKLTDSEIKDRLSVTVSRRMKKMENEKKREKIKIQQALARQMIESKMKQKIEQQEMARKAAEIQFQKRMEREQQRELLKRAKQYKLLEKRKQKDQIRLLREQERIQREDQLRMKRELRAHQMLEKQRQKVEDQQRRRYVKALRKAEERELKRQQTQMLKEQMRIKQEQERRRQHMMLLKALEQRKKQEERERQKEEKIAEKRLFRERKVEQRKMEFVLAQELKKPREDMELRDAREMPELPRIPGNLLDGEAFADCLMSLEFLHNFAKALGFDDETLPTMKSLQDSVTCKTEEDGEEYISLVSHLLRYALDDPGVANPKEAMTKLSQKVTDIEVVDGILSEVLRVFMVARNGGETELSEYLRNYPLEACSVSQRAGVIAFLCNELNCSKTITSEIEGHLDRMGDMRRDKWVVEGKLRRLRSIRAKKFHQNSVPSKPVGGEGDGDDSMMTNISKQNSDDEEEKDEGSGNEDESFTEGEGVTDEEPASLEECEKQMEKLQKQHAQYRDKVFEESHHVRALELGQDRYKRTYWILPHAGGVFVEGLESGGPKTGSKVKIKHDKSELKNIKIEVIDEKTEKKGVDLLEEITEKKASEIKKEAAEKEVKVEKDSSVKSEETSAMEVKTEEKQNGVNESSKVNGEEKMEVDQVKGEEKMEVDKVTDKDDVKLETSVVKHVEKLDDKADKLVTEESSEKVVNGEVNSNHDLDETNQKTPHHNLISGNSDSSKGAHKAVELKIPMIKSSAIDSESAVSSSPNYCLQVPRTTKLSDFCNITIDAAIKNDTSDLLPHHHTSSSSSSSLSSDHVTKSTNQSSLPSPPRPPPAHSSNKQRNFMSIDSILEKTAGSSQQSGGSSLFPNNIVPLNSYTSPHLKSLSADGHFPISDGKPWFSILPRVPCDDMSLTRGQHTSMSSGMLLSPPSFMSQIPFHPFPLQGSGGAAAFTSFQMGQLYSLDQGLSRASSSSSVATYQGDESFKKPEVPGLSSQNPDPDGVLKSLQGELKPIPEEFRSNWWRISEAIQIRRVRQCLHPRGIREKCLHKSIQKFYDYATASCTSAKKEVICMESSSEEETSEDEEEEEENAEGEKKEKESESDKTYKTSKEDEKDSSDSDTCVKDKKDKEEEATDDKEEDGKVDKEEEGKTDKKDDEKTDKKDDEKTDKKEDEKTDKKKDKKPVVVPVIDCKKKSDEADRIVLGEVEALEDKIAHASLQIKGWKLAPKTFSEESEVRIIPRGETKKDENDMYPVEAAKERLLQLESNVERRYLKPPLSKTHKINLNSSQNTSVANQESFDDNDDDIEFSNLPIGLQTWRIAVATATNPAQVLLCIMQLNKCISWEKSIMKVLCQICRKDDNEAELLLCDGCDRGYHTYCFKPKLDTIPEGDWYCFECVSKAAGENCCLVCGRRFGRMAECNTCSRCVHIDCLEPPLPRVPRKWFCASCEDFKTAKKRSRKNSATPSASSAPATPATPATPVVVNSTPNTPDVTPSGRKRRSDFGQPRKRKSSEAGGSENGGGTPKKEENGGGEKADKAADRAAEKQAEKERRAQLEQSTDMGVCRTLLTEMMKHEDGWPFLQPVNCKSFPSYRKYIKQPMDFGSMKIKLRDHVYNRRCEFVNDARLVFDNCKLFNEDDSEVGQCGHNMRKYFTKRWKEILNELMNESVEDN